MLKCNICDNSNLKDLVKFESNSGETFVVCSECIASADNTALRRVVHRRNSVVYS